MLAKPLGFVFGFTATMNGPIFETCVTTINGIMYNTHIYFPHVTSDTISQQYFNKFLKVVRKFCEKCKTEYLNY